MSFTIIGLIGAMLGAWLKRFIWKRSHGGIRGWFRRRHFTLKQKYRRWKFKRQSQRGRVVR